jgi:hypothetical protein
MALGVPGRRPAHVRDKFGVAQSGFSHEDGGPQGGPGLRLQARFDLLTIILRARKKRAWKKKP